MRLVELEPDIIGRPLQMYVHDSPEELVSGKIMQEGIWERWETELFLANLAPGDTVLDVGANVGYYSILAALAVGDKGRVFAFEPGRDNYRVLSANVANLALGNVEAVNAALANRNGTAELYLNNDNYGDHQIYDDGTCREKECVRVVAGDTFVGGEGGHVDFVKIDTQGAEFQVLNGLWDTLVKNRPGLKMILELWPKGLIRAGSSAGDVVELIYRLGLPVSVIDHMNGGLMPVKQHELLSWVSSVDQEKSNEGFVNLFVGASEG